MTLNIAELAWEKMHGLLPVIVQDATSGTVLMMAYMNQQALQLTLTTKQLTFFSRSKNKLWVKGETSGNKMDFVSISADCDQDTLLALAIPHGPACHQGTTSCFATAAQSDWTVIQTLQQTIAEREKSAAKNSYTAELFASGIQRMAQKVGEESVEVVIAALQADKTVLCNEAADLFFHLLVLLQAKKILLSDVIAILKDRQ